MTDLLQSSTVGTELRLVGGTDTEIDSQTGIGLRGEGIRPIWIEVTQAQRNVLLELTRDGACNKVIAQRLGVTEHTIKSHLKAVMSRIPHVKDRTELAVALLRMSVRTKVVTQPLSQRRLSRPQV